MKKTIIYLLSVLFTVSCGKKTNATGGKTIERIEYGHAASITPKPYEALWLEMAETDSGYVVYNYTEPWTSGSYRAPNFIEVKKDSLIWSTCYEPAARLRLNDLEIEQRKDGSFFFPIGNEFLFSLYDEETHIAQWKIYGDVEKDEPISSYLYIDSRYNTFPIIDFEWEDLPMDD
jgi:hypothetical protein